MKKLIAFALSAVLAVSAVAVPVSAEPAAQQHLSQNKVQILTAEELAQVRSQLPKQATEATQNILVPEVTEAVMTVSNEVAIDPELQVEPPVVAQVTAGKIVLEYREGYEYQRCDAYTIYSWNSSNILNVSADVEYTIRQRLAGRPETASEPIRVRSKSRVPCSVPTAEPIVRSRGGNEITLEKLDGYEYKIEGGDWVNNNVFRTLEQDTEYVFYQRIKETREEYASEPTSIRVRTRGPGGPSSYRNFDLLAQYITANGFENDDGFSTLAYSVELDANNVYYFVISYIHPNLVCDVFNVSADDTFIAFDTTFNIPRGSSYMNPASYILFYSDGQWIDQVQTDTSFIQVHDYQDNCFGQVGSSTYLPEETVSALFNSTVAMLAGFWDETIFEALGFGLKGLGFLSYDGLGELYCDFDSNFHLGEPVKEDYRAPGCGLSGYEGDMHCNLCGATVVSGSWIEPTSYHEYSGDCDRDCDHCGQLRAIVHIYSFACDTECDICGATRTDPLAAHKFEKNTCTVCGQEGGLLGDANGDGGVNMGDVSAVYSHIRRTIVLTDPVLLAMADVTGDGSINMGDVSRILAHVRGTQRLW